MSKEIADEYLSSLADLTVNSKPHINMLTILADENVDHAPAIVQVIENHIEKVSPEIKLPILYLIDSIIKNVSQVYVPLFTQNIVNIFVSVFEKVDEKTRINMYKLRQTWGDVFPARKLYVLDLRVKDIDHAWPVTAPTPTSIHFNPKFLGNKTNITEVTSSTSSTTTNISNTTPTVPTVTSSSSELSENVLRDQLLKKQKILIQLQQKKLELELMQTKVILEEQQKHANDPNVLAGLVRPPINDDTVKLLSQRASKPKTTVVSPSSVPNTKSVKTKIAPANTQIIEAVKSRDPRIARQQLQQSKTSEITNKEQEIYNRQLAMLKAPVVEQVVPVAPVQRVLSESNVKGHITINIERNRDREKFESRTKKQVKDNSKTDTSPTKSKLKQLPSKDSRSSPTRNQKNRSSSAKESKNTVKQSHTNSSNLEKTKTPPKNERSVSPGISRHSSPKSDGKWSKHSSHKHSRQYTSSPKKSSKNYSSSSPKSRRGGSSKSGSSSPKPRPSYSLDSASTEGESGEKNRRKSKKKHRKGDSENNSKYYDSSGDKNNAEYTSKKDKNVSPRREDKNVSETALDSKFDDKTSQEPILKIGLELEKKEELKSALDQIFRTDETGILMDSTLLSVLNDVPKVKDSDNELKYVRNQSDGLEKVVVSDGGSSAEKSDKLRYASLHLIESSPSPEPPPPPIISRSEEDLISDKKEEADFNELSEVDDDDVDVDEDIPVDKECKKERTGFKDLKGVSKGRNYMRRNRESSASPQKEAIIGDIDLRISGPPEKQPRLLFEEENIAENESKKLFSESLVNASGKDVDFRLLSVGGGSPSKKKLPTDSMLEQPPKKKSKTEAFDELFGNEDVDLRKITAPNLKPGERLPSPPPPPVISNGPAVPQIAAVAPIVVVDSCKGMDNDGIQLIEDNGENDLNRDNFDSNRGRHRRSWADFKIKPEAEVKPVSLSAQLEMEMDARKDSFSSFERDSEKGNKKHFRDRISHRGELDRLGRPLLYNKLPNDPRARRESLGVLDGRDTDMRRFGGLMERDIDTNINVNMIVAQAEDQVRNGTMSMHEYNELIKQVIHVNEKQKLREAQNKARQEVRRSQHHQRGRRSPNRYGSQNRDSPPYRHEDDRRERRPFNDIDERLPIPWRSMQRNDSSSVYGRMAYASGSSRSPFDMGSMDHRKYDDRSSLKQDMWEEEKRFRQLGVMDEPETSLNRGRDAVTSERTNDCIDVPPADPQVLEAIAKDPMKSISIDGTARDIRFYGDTAVVMLSWDDPKEISFEDGIRRVAIGDLNITCALNDSYGIFMINGKPHRIRLGAPTRELYIDGDFYEAHFGGPPVSVQIDGLQYLVQVEGPPPQVKIGKKRTDLICGRVNMIVDATAMLPLYLDSKPQRFDLRSRPYIFRFVNSLKTLLVNDVPLDIQFGGVCRQICGYGNLHFLRLSMLPNGVVPGCVQIVNMENVGASVLPAALEPTISGTNSPPLSNLPISISQGTSVNSTISDTSQLSSSRLPIPGGSLDILTSLMSGVAGSEQSVGFNYQVENKDQPPVQPIVSQVADTPPAQTAQATGIPFLGGTLNINDLFQRLVASGIVQTATNMNAAKQQTEDEAAIKAVDFSNPNSLRERQPAIINTIYSGIQCSSCGVRFSPEETVKYSRHLDWHFRQNRREKDAARKGQSRKWYYDVSDWIQFEEIEDLEERAQSWFDSETTGNAEEQEQDDVKSVPAPPGQEVTRCEMCRDQFDTYYNEEKEEWHLKPCIIVEDKYYHPLCYEDLMNMPEESLLANKTSDSLISVRDETGLEKDSMSVEDEELKEEEEEEEEMKITGEDGFRKIELKTELDAGLQISQSDESMEVEAVDSNPDVKIELNEDRDSAIQLLLNELINCIVYKEELEMEELEESSKEEEIEVLENVTLERKKNINVVDLIEKADDEEEEVYHRRSPSPITLIPPSKIKQEPVDEMESPVAIVDQTYTSVVSTIDGNVEMIDAPQIAPAAPSKIKITFNKPIISDHSSNSVQKVIIKDPNDATPEEVEPEPLPLKPKKPRIAEREMTVYLPCVKGTEVSGLCTIM